MRRVSYLDTRPSAYLLFSLSRSAFLSTYALFLRSDTLLQRSRSIRSGKIILYVDISDAGRDRNQSSLRVGSLRRRFELHEESDNNDNIPELICEGKLNMNALKDSEAAGEEVCSKDGRGTQKM